MRVRYLGGRTIEQYYSPNIGGGMTGHMGLVLHIAQGTYRGTIAWQMNPNQEYADGTPVTTSSTWIVGRNDGEWAQMVDTERIAWCQRAGSRDWLSIELAGHAPQAPTAWQVWACAQLLGLCHREYGVPLRVTGQTSVRGLGHHSMDNDTTVQWGHDSCPGTGVIGSKPAIVNLAVAQSQGADMTPEQAEQLAEIHEMLSDVRHVTVVRGKTTDDQWFTPGLEAAIGRIGVAMEDLTQRPTATVDVAALAEALAQRFTGLPVDYGAIQAACEAAVRAVNADAATP